MSSGVNADVLSPIFASAAILVCNAHWLAGIHFVVTFSLLPNEVSLRVNLLCLSDEALKVIVGIAEHGIDHSKSLEVMCDTQFLSHAHPAM